MSTQTIISGGSFDLTAPLTAGSSIEFLNNPSSSGLLTIETTGFENITVAPSGTSVVITGIGGPVAGFQAGDTIIVRDLATDYATFDHAPNAAAQNASVKKTFGTVLSAEAFLHENEIITVSGTGLVTDNLGLLQGQSLFGQTLAASIISEITTYATSIEQSLFGTAAQTASLFITIAADATTSTLADGIITTDGTIAICYLRGTHILTASGERRIEELRAGELVVTQAGGVRPIKWIGEQAFGARFVAHNHDQLPVRIAAGALADNQPLRDLYVSPGHSIRLGEVLVLARDLVNGVTITQPTRDEDVYYYNIEFDTHDCVLAEGVWAESYADAADLRNQFHNAGQFHALYPSYIAPQNPVLCAPRPEYGPALAAALRPVLARANVPPGPLNGYLETVGDTITGWAQDEANPEFPVMIGIFAGAERLGEVLANEYRGDLEAAGLGNGCCMFNFRLPGGLAGTQRDYVRAIRLADGAALPRSAACRAAA